MVAAIAATANCVLNAFVGPQVAKMKSGTDSGEPPSMPPMVGCAACLLSLNSCFFTVWFIIGNVWGFDVKTDLVPDASKTCGGMDDGLGFVVQVYFVVQYSLVGCICCCVPCLVGG